MEKTKEQRTKETLKQLKGLEDMLQDRLRKTDEAMQQAQAIGKTINDLKKQHSS